MLDFDRENSIRCKNKTSHSERILQFFFSFYTDVLFTVEIVTAKNMADSLVIIHFLQSPERTRQVDRHVSLPTAVSLDIKFWSLLIHASNSELPGKDYIEGMDLLKIPKLAYLPCI